VYVKLFHVRNKHCERSFRISDKVEDLVDRYALKYHPIPLSGSGYDAWQKTDKHAPETVFKDSICNTKEDQMYLETPLVLRIVNVI